MFEDLGSLGSVHSGDLASIYGLVAFVRVPVGLRVIHCRYSYLG